MGMIGKAFDDFTIVDKIGEGGMGKVYLAVQNSLDREVAIKAIVADQSFDSSEKVERFLREARVTASIQHPNIVNVHKVGKHENFFYIAMEYVDGNSLDTVLRKNALSETVTWQIALQICYGLQAALQKGIIHRDIKPGNILLLPGNTAKLTDFGLSKKVSDEAQLTQAGAILGSPSYMSPEQASGKEATFQSDIYSLGATVYHMLTGQVMFIGDSIVEILYKHQSESPPSPQEYSLSISRESSMVLAKMIAKQPVDRYQSYGDLIADITGLMHGKELNFSETSDALSSFRPDSKFHKTGKKKILGSLFSGFGNTRKMGIAKRRLFFVTELVDSSALPKCEGYKTHIIASQTELRSSLQNYESARVLLDGKRLGPAAADFLDILRREFPKTALIIMLDAIPEKVPDRLNRLFFPCGEKCEEEIKKTLVQSLKNLEKFYAGQLNLQIVMVLAKSQKWTARLWIDEGTPNEGKIILRQGKIVSAKRGELQGKKALDLLIKHNLSWQSNKSHFKSSMNASLEVSSSSQSSSLNLRTESLSEHEDGEKSKTDGEKSKIEDTRTVLSLPPETLSEEKRAVEEIHGEKFKESDGQSEPRPVEEEISEDETIFNEFMDAALDALLIKDYRTACENFWKAGKIYPDEARVKTNLDRLKEMGYSMEEDK